ncbi:GNAT family N-acetyltransferase [Alicyclobacillus fastidiosus]|uniref:GNAT family N-acetyltransferase n=1 Tax=Alicyclobacillus fastidiosus TaxID=392011 RepID=A0ABV5A9N2_9BACL|nr:GNAT family N-acetyltransferase [Alicyclobacillus fastidiosus]WEH12012.1 GNAT family N-acetyltransferase [Alicyclobacillus fastidiosus]
MEQPLSCDKGKCYTGPGDLLLRCGLVVHPDYRNQGIGTEIVRR